MAYILTRDLGDGVSEIVAFSIWNSYEDIRRFTGDDVDQMVLYPMDREFLLDTPTLVHYLVTDPTAPTGPTGAAS